MRLKIIGLLNFALFALLFIAAFSTAVNAQGGEEVIRVNTDLVTIPTLIQDRAGRYVTDLKKEDFQILENGVEQEIALFESTEQPFTALLLLDTSGSMKLYMQNLTRAVNTFIKQLRSEDQVIVATFSDSHEIKIIQDATRKKNLVHEITLQPKPAGEFEALTATFDAVKNGLDQMRKFQGRRAIILFSDGEQHGLKTTAKDNLRDAEHQQATLYTVRFGDYPKSSLFKNADRYMNDLARKTGGRSYHIENIGNLEQTFGTISDELGRQYNLGYYPKTQPEEGQSRQITVKTKQSNLIVQARDSYVPDSSKDNQ